MNTIHLHGPLRKRFGGPFRLAVTTPAEALRALTFQLDGFGKALEEGNWRIRRGPLARGQGRFLTEPELRVNLPGEMHILAAAKGAGGRGGAVAKVLVGAAIVAAVVLSLIHI